jgi:predicted Co/Zn/Cd cation transporter (cation efflux family)
MTAVLIVCYVLVAALSTAIASAAHGGNHLPKGWVVALHFLAAPFAAPVFWTFLRRGKQARAELDYLTGRGSLSAVAASYPPGLGRLMARVIGWCLTHPIQGLAPRRQQELCGGLVLGTVLGVLTSPILLAVALST